MDVQGCEKILLTGAGFTHNFGAPLAQGIWSEIFNHRAVQNTPKVRELMLGNYDYESVYFNILEGDYPGEEKDVISLAVESAYVDMDSTINAFVYTSTSAFPVNIYLVNELLSKFSQENRHGFMFTLNQDLFVERHFNSDSMPVIPGIQNNQDWFTSRFTYMLSSEKYIGLPIEAELNEIRANLESLRKFFYIKLHGSCNWIDSSGSRKMVIGRGKEEIIQREPLLKWYFEIFKEVLFQPERKLLVMGYGFGDAHINKILAEAVVEYDLKIYIVNPTPPEKIGDFLTETSDGSYIWDGLSEYFPYTLLQMFPGDRTKTEARRSLLENFFGSS